MLGRVLGVDVDKCCDPVRANTAPGDSGEVQAETRCSTRCGKHAKSCSHVLHSHAGYQSQDRMNVRPRVKYDTAYICCYATTINSSSGDSLVPWRFAINELLGVAGLSLTHQQ